MHIVSRCFSVVYILFLSVSCSGGGADSSRSPSNSKVSIGAHYYVWYPENFNHGHLRSKLSPPQEPLLGHYSSANPLVAEEHIRTASEYGIDYFTLDWWPSRKSQNEAIKNGFLNARNIAQINFCIFYETIDLGFDEKTHTIFIDAAKKKKFIDDLKQIAREYLSHPQYFRVNGKPVIFFYVTRTLGGDYESMINEARAELQSMGHDPFFVGDEIYWISTHNSDGGPIVIGEPNVSRIGLFDAITAYNSYAPSLTLHSGYGIASTHLSDTAQLYERFKQAAPGVKIIPGVLPGYNDRGHRLAINNYAIARSYSPEEDQGSMLREYLQQIGARYIDPIIKGVVITSWNEWNEDTAIEPIQSTPLSAEDSRGGAFTQGLNYGGNGFEALNSVREFKATY